MNKISGVVIVKNGQDLISDCLKSLAFCDEIIIIDANSKDKTVEIAKSMGARIFSHSFNDFSQMRNLGLEKASHEWIIYIDIDERVSKELAEDIKTRALSNPESSIAAYKVLRKNYYFGNNEWPYVDKLERVFKKDKLKKWYGELHESPILDGKIATLNGYLFHYTHRDLTSMLDKTIAWSEVEARLRFDSNHPKMSWWRFPRVMLSAFFNSYVKQGGYKAGTVGIVESTYQAFSMFITYARLWEMQNSKNIKD